jgi:glycosyltransferase involved in cell wall biosynthesis
MEKVSIVIPVYGQWHLAKRNIDALLRHDCQYIAEIIVVDDCSPEKNPYQFDEELVRVISNNENKGYTSTVNNGLKKAASDIIVLLDSDAYPISPFIQKMLGMYAADLSLGCVGFGTVDDNGKETGSYIYEPALLGLIVGQQLEMRLGLRKNKNILPFSCSVSFRKSCLEELGYFNEQIFPVLDADLDISMLIHRSKWKLIYTKEIILSHQGGNSYKVNSKRVILFHESRWKLLKKYDLVPFPALAKLFIKTRIGFEVAAFKLLSAFSKSSSDKYTEKIKGRKTLLERIDDYK